ncbi:hypothetical protein O9993_19210 [Vibrio lentus]|nr:hypothetical protein [Vibrio lentus]
MCLSILKQLEVNANIQLFARQWVEENGVDSLSMISCLCLTGYLCRTDLFRC